MFISFRRRIELFFFKIFGISNLYLTKAQLKSFLMKIFVIFNMRDFYDSFLFLYSFSHLLWKVLIGFLRAKCVWFLFGYKKGFKISLFFFICFVCSLDILLFIQFFFWWGGGILLILENFFFLLVSSERVLKMATNPSIVYICWKSPSRFCRLGLRAKEEKRKNR